MRLTVVAVLLSLFITPSLEAGDSFRAIARSLDAHPSLQRRPVPFVWLARAATRMIRPEGVQDLRMVRFEGTGNTSQATLLAVRGAESIGYSRVVHVTERSGASSFILARERPGNRIQLIVLNQEPGETVLIEVLLDREIFIEKLASGRGTRLLTD